MSDSLAGCREVYRTCYRVADSRMWNCQRFVRSEVNSLRHRRRPFSGSRGYSGLHSARLPRVDFWDHLGFGNGFGKNVVVQLGLSRVGTLTFNRRLISSVPGVCESNNYQEMLKQRANQDPAEVNAREAKRRNTRGKGKFVDENSPLGIYFKFQNANDSEGLLKWLQDNEDPNILEKIVMPNTVGGLSRLLTDFRIVEKVKDIFVKLNCNSETKRNCLSGLFANLVGLYCDAGRLDRAIATLNEMPENYEIYPQQRVYGKVLYALKNMMRTADHVDTMVTLFDSMRSVLFCEYNPPQFVNEDNYALVLEGLLNVLEAEKDSSEGEKPSQLAKTALKFFDRILCDSLQDVLCPGDRFLKVIERRFSNGLDHEASKWTISHNSTVLDRVCKSCSSQLVSVDLSRSEMEKLEDQVRGLLPRQHPALNKFEAWISDLKKRGCDIVVDVANVAFYHTQGKFVLKIADAMVEHLRKIGKRPALILHASRVYDASRHPSDHAIISKWKSDDILFIAPVATNDDFFWLYTAVKLGGETLLLSNDRMRDHHFSMLSRRQFSRWSERHVATFDLENNKGEMVTEIRIQFPRNVPLRAQVSCDKDGRIRRYHTPYIIRDEVSPHEQGCPQVEDIKDEEVKWLCICSAEDS